MRLGKKEIIYKQPKAVLDPDEAMQDTNKPSTQSTPPKGTERGAKRAYFVKEDTLLKSESYQASMMF